MGAGMRASTWRGRVRAAALVLATCAGLAGQAGAQADGGSRFGVAAGLGGGYFQGDGSGDGEGLAAMAEVSYRSGPHLFSARGALIAEILGDGMVDFGLLYGRSREGGASHLSASAGLGLVVFQDCPIGLATGLCRSEFGLGLPLALRASWRPSRFVGFGIQALANIKPSRSFVAGALFVEAGRLR
ncbi:MAG TPA: hypothetical protein VMM35_05625 [Longimicrobiales bacterium]|nr:hypothetical protein [Longimicrobiales bacterium]